MAKKLTAFICVLALCMSFVVPVSANGVGVVVDTVTAQQGTTVSVPIRISGNTGLAGAQFSLSYANGLSLEGIVPGAALGSLEFTPPGDLTANPVTLMWDGKDDDATNGVLATLKFNVANLTPGEYPISITPVTSGNYDDDLNDVAVNVTNGKIVVVETGSSSGGGDAPKIEVLSAEAKTGENVDVKIALSGNEGENGIGGITLYVAIPDGLTLISTQKGAALESLTFTPNGDITSNPFKLVWDGQDGDKTNGEIAILTFKVADNQEDGNILPISITYNIGDIYDGNMDDINGVQIVNGNVTIKNYILGDVNDDGVVNGKDITYLRKCIAGGYGLTADAKPADVNKDGVVNGKDITYLRKCIAGGYGFTLE